MFSFLNRELKIGDNRKTGIEAKQRGKGRNEREGEEEREKETDSKQQMKKAYCHPESIFRSSNLSLCMCNFLPQWGFSNNGKSPDNPV